MVSLSCYASAQRLFAIIFSDLIPHRRLHAQQTHKARTVPSGKAKAGKILFK
jgi:hypothetical protein